MFFVFGSIALMSAFMPVEAVQAYGPFQSLSSYPPLSPDWFLMWIEGAWRLLPRQLNFHLLGADFSNPFYGAVYLPVLVFGGCAIYPLIDAHIYGNRALANHMLERPRERPFRTAFGVSGPLFLVFLSLGVLDGPMASAFGVEVWRADLILGVLTLSVPPAIFATVLLLLRASRTTPGASEHPCGPDGTAGPALEDARHADPVQRIDVEDAR